MWQEHKHEDEGVVPSHWIERNVVCWPKVSNASKYMKERSRPSHLWWKFPLVKVKFTSGMLFVCFYDYCILMCSCISTLEMCVGLNNSDVLIFH